MTKVLAALGAALLLATCAIGGQPSLYRAVQPLVFGLKDDGTLDIHCTVWKVEMQRSLWVTANHCVRNELQPYYIGRVPASVWRRQPEIDLAALQTKADPSIPALKIADKLDWTRPLIMAGHPYGIKDLIITRGWVAGQGDQDVFGVRRYTYFDITGYGGNSGSPILQDGKVVSVLQIGWPFPLHGGAPLNVLQAFVKGL